MHGEEVVRNKPEEDGIETIELSYGQLEAVLGETQRDAISKLCHSSGVTNGMV